MHQWNVQSKECSRHWRLSIAGTQEPDGLGRWKSAALQGAGEERDSDWRGQEGGRLNLQSGLRMEPWGIPMYKR